MVIKQVDLVRVPLKEHRARTIPEECDSAGA